MGELIKVKTSLLVPTQNELNQKTIDFYMKLRRV
jgi:hypothetical protein